MLLDPDPGQPNQCGSMRIRIYNFESNITFAKTSRFSSLLSKSLKKDLLRVPGFEPRGLPFVEFEYKTKRIQFIGIFYCYIYRDGTSTYLPKMC
jgi:hypothetical protein